MTLFKCCSFSLRHCRVGLPKPNVVYRCTMNNLIVFVELHLSVHLNLTKSYTPASLLTAARRNTLSKTIDRKPLMALSPETVALDFIDGELLPCNIGLTT